MRGRLLLGQSLTIAGIVLLLAFVPLTPRVTGLPKHRILETSLFWASFGLLMLGGGQSLAATPHHSDGERRAILAAAGVAAAALLCVIALTNLLYSSMQGIGFRLPGTYPGRLYPRALGYVLYLPLILSLGCQLPLLCFAASAPAVAPIHRPSTARLVLLVLMGLLFLLFGGACLLFLLDRSFAAGAVAATWFASLLMLGAALDQLSSVRSHPGGRPIYGRPPN